MKMCVRHERQAAEFVQASLAILSNDESDPKEVRMRIPKNRPQRFAIPPGFRDGLDADEELTCWSSSLKVHYPSGLERLFLALSAATGGLIALGRRRMR